MSQTTKCPYSEVFPVAKRIVEKLAPHCERIEIAGSLRRGREMVGDIELVALPRRQLNLLGQEIEGVDTALDAFLCPRVTFTKNGPKYKQFKYGACTVDLFLPASASHWGSIFQIRTGSQEFNLWIQNEVAPRVGVKFRDGLIYRDGQLVNTTQEPYVFSALDLPWVPPARRDNQEWLEVIEKAKVHA